MKGVSAVDVQKASRPKSQPESVNYPAQCRSEMSDDEADPELLELLRQSLGISRPTHGEVSSDTGMWRHCLLRRLLVSYMNPLFFDA